MGIFTIILRELWRLFEDSQRVKDVSDVEIAAKLDKIAGIIALVRCKRSLESLDVHRKLILLYRPGLVDAGAIEPEVQAAIARCEAWPLTPNLISSLEAVAVGDTTLENVVAIIKKDEAKLQPHNEVDPSFSSQSSALAKKSPGAPTGFVGIYHRYPDFTGRRQVEGGQRLVGKEKRSLPNLPLVTIVTALFKNDKTLQRCIDSVAAQTYKNIEHIIIDGGSPASTLDILSQNKHQLDYFISEPDRGIYDAMNKGIRLANGDYVCLLNSDDFYEPNFIEEVVARATQTNADIVYTDYFHSKNYMSAQPISAGVLLGHLNICHNTFLVSRASYNHIGPYEERFRIVSDAVWIRKAWRKGLRFERVPQALFTLTEGGMSSGNTEARRQLFINEAVESYREEFAHLSRSEAEEIYLFRFNKKRTRELVRIAQIHVVQSPLFKDALARYIEYCFSERENFIVGRHEPISLFTAMIELAEITGADRRCIRVETKNGLFGDLLRQIDVLTEKRKLNAKRTVLHFVTVFSAPSETFIYDLLTNMEADPRYDNFVLFEHEKLAAERPFAKAHKIFVNDYPAEIVQAIYKYLVDTIKPDVLIAHFAINEHRFHMRSAPVGVCLPTVVMTHGIDVFQLKAPSEYRDYVLGDLSSRSDVCFTAVSEYLRRELIEAGVPAHKVVLVRNSVNERFLRHRKTADFFDGSRTLRLLCIGRLIDWKAHDVLIDALAQFRDECTEDFELTIVYGGGDQLLERLTEQARRLGLENNVKFEPFVDFSKHPGYVARFDAYVHPSSYSDCYMRKSETFGVAVLEAIMAGLPVITTDAGGLPEVVGEPNTHARIVPHRNTEALFAALRELYRDRKSFADNLGYARERLKRFSPEGQLEALSGAIETVCCKPLRAALISSSTVQGAGYAAYRLHRGLRETAVSPHMFTTVRNHENDPDVTVLPHPSGDNGAWAAQQMKPPPGLTIFTLDVPNLSTPDVLAMLAPYDVINLHWHARFISIENIAALTGTDKPVVLTIRDMMPITGGCHFFHGCDRWLRDCRPCPQMPPLLRNAPGDALAAKRASYNFSNLTLVAISNHSRQLLERAPYFRDCRIETIPNSIELDVFRPYDKSEQRKALGLPHDRKIIGYVPSFSSEVKGYREFLQALDRLDPAELGGDPVILLVGNETPATQKIRQHKKVLGYISDNIHLARAYSAADLVVVPSLEETFSNTTAEAIACGTPVVGFKTGAIPELAIDGITGYTYEPGDVAGLVEGMMRVLNGPDMSRACRDHAEKTLSFMTQARRYEALFKELVAATRVGGTTSQNRLSMCLDESAART